MNVKVEVGTWDGLIGNFTWFDLEGSSVRINSWNMGPSKILV